MTQGSVIVIGVGPGLGLALARIFHDAGHSVALFGRTDQRLNHFATELAGGEAVRAYAVDVADEQALRAGLTQAIGELGAPEVLIYNAAIMRPDTPTDGDTAGWEYSFKVNVLGAKIATEAVLPAMNGRGSLLFTGGGLAENPSPEYASLSLGKASLRAYVRALAVEQAPKGVRATVITLNGGVNSGPESWSASAVAQDYLDLHRQEAVSWTAEVVRN